MNAFTLAAAEAASTEAGVDREFVAAIMAGVGAGGGGVKVVELLMGRRKGKAEAEKIVSTAMESFVNSAVSAASSLIEPQHRLIEAMRLQHASDINDLRTQHTAAMTRMGDEVTELKRQFAIVLSENGELRTTLAVMEARQR